jgi:Ras family protein T1
MNHPLHVSVTWNSISELFVALAEAATNPSTGFPKTDEEDVPDRTSLYMALGATACAAVAALMIWRRSTNAT